MEALTYQKDKVLERLKKNRDKHKKDAAEAQKQYQKKVVQLLEQELDRAKKDKQINHMFLNGVPLPMDYTDNYDRIIDQLENSLGSEVELTEGEFRMYMRDEWEWKRHFAASNAAYSQ